jgi:hypothetical protein
MIDTTTATQTLFPEDCSNNNDHGDDVGHEKPPPFSPSPTTTTESSDCGTEISVSARREWLKNFGKQHETNPFRKTTTTTTMTTPTRLVSSSAAANQPNQQPRQGRDDVEEDPRTVPVAPKVTTTTTGNAPKALPPKPQTKSTPIKSMQSSSQAAASTLVNRLVNAPSPATATTGRLTSGAAPRRTSTSSTSSSSSLHHFSAPLSGSTPLRSIRSIRKEEVKATDEGYASVAKLSEWLASDPTSTRKKKHVRRGRNVILKSRQFEKDQEDIIIVENNISRGAVQDKKKWLQSAFRAAEEELHDDDTSSMVSGGGRYAKSEIAGGAASYYNTSRFREVSRAKTSSVSDSQSEIITDDAASSLSVADKKDWLKNAFSSSKTTTFTSPAKQGYAKAHTDVMHGRGQTRDEVASRAKMRFKERSNRKLLDAPTPTKSSTPSKCDNGMACEQEERANPPTNLTLQIEEDTTPVDFRAARDALVERSKMNGHKVQVVNKVYLRKKKYEKLEQEARRKSSPHGLLKPSWDIADPSTGRPSNVYDKKFVSDIAPKKSFEELP